MMCVCSTMHRLLAATTLRESWRRLTVPNVMEDQYRAGVPAGVLQVGLRARPLQQTGHFSYHFPVTTRSILSSAARKSLRKPPSRSPPLRLLPCKLRSAGRRLLRTRIRRIPTHPFYGGGSIWRFSGSGSFRCARWHPFDEHPAAVHGRRSGYYSAHG